MENKKKLPALVALTGFLWVLKGLAIFYFLYIYRQEIFFTNIQNNLLAATIVAAVLIAAAAIIAGLFLFFLHLWARNTILFLVLLAETSIIAKIAFGFIQKTMRTFAFDFTMFLIITFLSITYYFILDKKHFVSY